MRLVIIGDVGVSDRYHAGDEAMLEALLEELQRRTHDDELTATVISGRPADTLVRDGVRSIDRIGFGGTNTPRRRDQEARLENVIAAVRGHASQLEPADPAWRVIEAIADCDAVVVSGGGDSVTPFREQLYECAAVASIARMFETRLVVIGLSISPQLDARDEALVSEILGSAVVVGVRDEQSFADAQRLADGRVPAIRTFDGASFLVGAAPTLPELSALVPGEYVVASLSPHAGLIQLDDYAEQLAEVVSQLASLSDVPVVLVTQEAPVDAQVRGLDVEFHNRIASALKLDSIFSAPRLDARQIVHVTRGAAFSLSNRYHPAVFALAGGVPTVGIGVDSYTTRAISGTFAQFGVDELVVPTLSLVTGDATAVVQDAWNRRAAIRTQLTNRAESARAFQSAWWDLVTSALSGRSFGAEIVFPEVARLALTDSRLSNRLLRLTHYTESVDGLVSEKSEAAESAAEAADSLARRLDDLIDAVHCHEQTEQTLRQEVEVQRAAVAASSVAFDEAPDPSEDVSRDSAAVDAVELQLEVLTREIDALGQQFFERERYSAFLGSQLHAEAARANEADRAREAAAEDVMLLSEQLEEKQDAIRQLEAKVAGLVASTSWRASLPMRVVRNPKPYIQKMRKR